MADRESQVSKPDRRARSSVAPMSDADKEGEMLWGIALQEAMARTQRAQNQQAQAVYTGQGRGPTGQGYAAAAQGMRFVPDNQFTGKNSPEYEDAYWAANRMNERKGLEDYTAAYNRNQRADQVAAAFLPRWMRRR